MPTTSKSCRRPQNHGDDRNAPSFSDWQVSGVDAETEDEELFMNVRTGLAQCFGLASVEAVTVGASGTLDDEDDEDDGVGGGVVTPSPAAPATLGIDAGTPAPGATAETVTGGDGESLQRRRRRALLPSERERAAPSSRANSGPGSMSSPDRHYHYHHRAANLRQDVPRAAGHRHPVEGGVDGDFGGDADAGGFFRPRRWLQEDGGEEGYAGDGSAGETMDVDIDFEVALPVTDASPASRVATAVNNYADDGVYALADALGVEPMDVRCDVWCVVCGEKKARALFSFFFLLCVLHRIMTQDVREKKGKDKITMVLVCRKYHIKGCTAVEDHNNSLRWCCTVSDFVCTFGRTRRWHLFRGDVMDGTSPSLPALSSFSSSNVSPSFICSCFSLLLRVAPDQIGS